jgi:AmmeMemoRadiSam system protein B
MKANPREPAVAGAFYPGSESELQNQLQGLVSVQEMRHQLLACIAPHAGYIYSGSVAGTLFGHLDVPRRVVILGPNHTGMGGAMAVASHPKWRTPLGDVAVDLEFSRMLIESHQPAAFDDIAHRQEHSLEVQLPLLLARQPELQFVPICLGHLSLDDCLELGLSIARLISGIGKTVGIVASSDMSHYLPDGEARTQDRMAIDAALARDPEALYKTVRSNGITMCGVVPATVALAAANQLGASDAHLVAYATSGDVSGDRSAVVGYAGMCIHR